jgi:hypothetical protein
MATSILVKLALGALRDALKEVVTVENVDNLHDSLITRAQAAGNDFLAGRPVLQQSFDAVCSKAKEGTAVATVIVSAINGILEFQVGAPAPEVDGSLAPISGDLMKMQEAFVTGCCDDDCDDPDCPEDCDDGKCCD